MNLFTNPDNGEEDADNDQHIPPRHCRFAVSPGCAATVNKLLSAKQYAYRWPKIPKHELLASSITHPFKTEWKWLLHTRRIEDSKLDENGMAPPVHVCPALRNVVHVGVSTCVPLHNGVLGVAHVRSSHVFFQTCIRKVCCVVTLCMAATSVNTLALCWSSRCTHSCNV